MSFKDNVRRLFHNSNGKRGLRKLSSPKRRRISIEPLEPRLCLNGTAEISGQWLVEGTAAGPYCSGVVVFLDSGDFNGLMDESEDFRVTSATGYFHFTGVEAGTYRVTQLHQRGVDQKPDFEYSWRHGIGEDGYYKTIIVSEGEIVRGVNIEPNTLNALDTADVFFALDNTGSFEGAGSILTQAATNIVTDLQESDMPVDWAFGVSYFEDFSPDPNVPFYLAQSMKRANLPDFDTVFANALDVSNQPPGGGNGSFASLNEALYKSATTSVGFRSGPYHLSVIVAATDVGTVRKPEPSGTTVIEGIDDVQVPLANFTVGGRDETDPAHTIQEAVNELNEDDIKVIGLGSNGAGSEPISMLKAYSTVTGGVLSEESEGIYDDETLLIDVGEELYFTIENHSDDIGEHVADAIRSLVGCHLVSGSISGHDYLDSNANDEYNNGELQLSDPPVYASLYGLSAPGDIEHAIKATWNPATEEYEFLNLRPALYRVWVDPAYYAQYTGISDPDPYDEYDYPLEIRVGRGDDIEGIDFKLLHGFAEDDYAETDVDTGVNIYALSNDTGEVIGSFYSFTQPENGIVTWNGSSTWSGSSFTYTPDSGWHGKDTFTYTLRYSPAPPDEQFYMTATVTVCVGEAPVLDLDADNSTATGADFTGVFAVGGGPVSVVDQIDASLSDSDDTHLQSLTVTLTNPSNGWYESLSADTTGTNITATAYNRFSGELVLSGNDTIANYTTVLQSITYNNTSPYPDATPREIEFVVNDSAFDSNVGTATIDIEFARRVMKVEVGNANYMYEIGTSSDGHDQLMPIMPDPNDALDGGVDRVTITFDRPIDDIPAVQDALTVNGRASGGWGNATSATFSVDRTEVTWLFGGGPFEAGEMVLRLTGEVETNGIILDGEWTSPATFNDDSNNSSFDIDQGSGDGAPGGDFLFNITLPNTRAGDANRDGVVDSTDQAILATNWLSGPGATWSMGDFNDDGYVNEIDYTILSATMGAYVWWTRAFPSSFEVATGGSLSDILYNPDLGQENGVTFERVDQASHGSATVNADGSFTYTPTAGYTGEDTFTFRVFDGTLHSAPATVTIYVGAPKVIAVYVKNSTTWEWAAIGTAADNDDQLMPVPIYDGIDVIAIHFDRAVTVAQADLTLYVDGVTMDGADADSFTNIGGTLYEWTFSTDGPFKTGPMTIELSDAVNTNGMALDGEWTSPEHYDDNTDNSTFDGGLTSGDGQRGGDFVFNFSMLHPGDANCDGVVSATDLSILGANYNQGPGLTWSDGDFNYDGYVDFLDFTILNSKYGSTVWPAPAPLAMMGGGGLESLAISSTSSFRTIDSRSSFSALDLLFEQYSLAKPVVGSDEWEDSLDDFFAAFDKTDLYDTVETYESPHHVSNDLLGEILNPFELLEV